MPVDLLFDDLHGDWHRSFGKHFDVTSGLVEQRFGWNDTVD